MCDMSEAASRPESVVDECFVSSAGEGDGREGIEVERSFWGVGGDDNRATDVVAIV